VAVKSKFLSSILVFGTIKTDGRSETHGLFRRSSILVLLLSKHVLFVFILLDKYPYKGRQNPRYSKSSMHILKMILQHVFINYSIFFPSIYLQKLGSSLGM